jgi:hypothetical protein
LKTTVSVEAASLSCNKKQEPLLIRREEECSPVGADGRVDGGIYGIRFYFHHVCVLGLADLTRVSIGWNIGRKFIEQIGLCVDERMFATIWTKYTLHGANIDFRDIDPKRPGFRIDTTGTKHFFPWATSTKMNTYYSKKSQLSQVKKILGTNNKMGAFKIIDAGRRGTHYFSKVFTVAIYIHLSTSLLNPSHRAISLQMPLLCTMCCRMPPTTL